MTRYRYDNAHNGRPVTSHEVVMVGRRVMKVTTRHVGRSIWVATGVVSEEIPTGARLTRPCELKATGSTEEEAVHNLRQRVSQLQFDE